MKHFFLFFSFVIALTLFGCNDKVGEVLDVQDEQTETEDSIFTYDMYFDSEITSYDGTTRAAMVSDWEDGDVVFLYFGGNNDTYGKAEYISKSKKWRVTCGKALDDVANASCEAWCCKGVNPYEEAEYISYKWMTEAYTASNGLYTYSNNSIYVNVTMHPLGWRLRFRGEVGTKVEVQETTGFSLYKIILKNHARYYGLRSESFVLTVGSNGYTDFFVGSAESSCTNISITNENTGESFTRYFDNNTLKRGESGCFTIPTSSDLHGWTKTSGSNTINGHEYVDLGLPSGTLWATCNIGASSPEEFGGYFAWGETEEKDRYDGDTYAYVDEWDDIISLGDDIAGTIYDVAHMKWGGSWQMPSYNQIQELIDFCTTENINRNGVSGTLVTGPNGNSFFLPDAGGQWDGSPWMGSDFGYWSSTNFGSLDRCKFKAYNGVFEIFPDFPPIGMPVRAVSKTTSAAYAIDLGLPSGTKWASCNVGASSSEQVGNYYA